ncbi:MAG: L,D-transpeptidase family protein [Bacteroidaceae bacterium]
MSKTFAKNHLNILLLSTSFLLLMSSCGASSTTDTEEVFRQQAYQAALQLCSVGHSHPKGDKALASFYEDHKRLCWVDNWDDTLSIQTLFTALSQLDRYGLKKEEFNFDELKENYFYLKSLHTDSLHLYPKALAELDYHLSESYLLYAIGLRYGFIKPTKILNKKYFEEDENGDSIQHVDEGFAIKIESADSTFLRNSLEAVLDDVSGYLLSLEPQNNLYKELKLALSKKPSSTDDVKRQRATLEILRWRPVDSIKGKHVLVNLAAEQLFAYHSNGSLAESMRICIGSKKHKTPMLTASITRLETNPYWNIPQSILKKEILPLVRRDTSYFTKHRITLLTKGGAKAPLKDLLAFDGSDNIPFRLRQENGPSNSLGQMIFRFKNKFDVYLHDTSAPSVFLKKNRAVSHGCVRLERPIALLEFLENDPARCAGILQKMKPNEKGEYTLRNYELSAAVALLINYYPYGLNERGALKNYGDPYKYVPLITAELKTVGIN